jgi:predicted RNA-binding Zn-ribbon protein involved in translation (DUF1610 family)
MTDGKRGGNDGTSKITVVENTAIQQAIDFFNEEFFDGKLPDVFVRYDTRANSDGFYTPSGFSARDGKYEKDSIALNSDRFVGKTDLQILAELFHNLGHHANYHFGSAPARHYHDEEWANLMMSADVMPSSTGAAGGKITGKKMSHYVIPGGQFEKACEKLFATGWHINLQSTPVPGSKVKTDKAKDTLICPGCNDRTWSSKRGKRWICPDCGYLTILRDADPSEIKRYRLIEIERDADASLVRQTETDAPYERPQPVQALEPAVASYEQQAIDPKRIERDSVDVHWMRDTVSAGNYRFDQRSPDWVGVPLMERLGLRDNRDSRKRVAAMLKACFKSGVLAIEIRQDDRYHDRKYVIPGPCCPEDKPKPDVQSYERQPQPKPKRGRPKGSKNKRKDLPSYDATSPVEQPVKRKRGRPKGSKNKPKEFDAASPLA